MKLMTVTAVAALAAGIAQAQEGPLQIYSAYPAEQMQALIDGFSAKYPGVEVQLSVQPGEQLLSTLELELRAGSPQADVVGLNQASIGALQATHSAMAEYTPAGVEGMRQEVLDPSGTSVPACVNIYLIQYNTNAIAAADAPKSWADLADPKWKDQIALADPASSQSVHSFLWFATTYAPEHDMGLGWDYIAALGANGVQLEKSHGTIRDLTASGERPLGVNLLANAQTSANRGDPTSLVWPAEGSPGEISSFAMFEGSDNPAAAQAWLDYIVSPEAQALMPQSLGCAPVLSELDYKFPDGTAVGDVTIVPVDTTFISENKDDQIAKFAETFGR